jgi:hypothetical protein
MSPSLFSSEFGVKTLARFRANGTAFSLVERAQLLFDFLRGGMGTIGLLNVFVACHIEWSETECLGGLYTAAVTIGRDKSSSHRIEPCILFVINGSTSWCFRVDSIIIQIQCEPSHRDGLRSRWYNGVFKQKYFLSCDCQIQARYQFFMFTNNIIS